MRRLMGLPLLLGIATLAGHAGTTEPLPCKTTECLENELAEQIANLLAPNEYVLVSLGQSHHTEALSLAVHELLWDRVRKQDKASPAARAVSAEMLIDAYLRVGMSREATELFESLDENLRQRATVGPVVSQIADSRDLKYAFMGLSVDASPALTAAGLAVAYAGAGKPDSAEALLKMSAQFRPSGEKEYDGGLSVRSERAATCTRQLIEATADSDAFLWRFGDGKHSGCAGALAARAFARRTAQWLDHAGLPEAWRTGVEANDCETCSSSGEEDLEVSLKKFPEIEARIAELKSLLAEIDRSDAQWIELGKRLERDMGPGRGNDNAPQSSARDRAASTAVAGRLEQAVFNPYRIEDLKTPPGAKPTKAKSCAGAALRCADIGQVRWELLMSKDYDPSGEVPAAGYWLRRTELPDGQPRSFYLGIKEHIPFELVDSNAPFIVEGELQLQVRRAAIDPGKITFPPIGLDIRADKKALLLRASLSEVMRDSDEDGLTDLAEQQLLLDPQNADSDVDGMPDGKDPLPNVAFSSESTEHRRAFAAALPLLLEEPDLAISFGVTGSDAFVRQQSSDERTLFVIADPEDMAGISASRRIVVLPTSLDIQQLRKQPAFALFYPMHLSLRMLDDKHAELIYSANWQGGTLALELHEGVWRVGTLSSWVT